jgi:hypothetical protein
MRLRSITRSLSLGLATVWCLAAPPAHAQTAHDVLDPHFGDTLFQFFQDRYFTSVTTLMVSQHFGRVSHHAEEAEVLRGGILLSYGLHREAGAIFEKLIAMGATPRTRDRAWYYLAKIRYQRGYLPEAHDAMGRIGKDLPVEFLDDRGLLQAQLLMARADYAGAAAVLAALDTKTPGARYAQYNLGVALIKSGNTAGGTAVLNTLGQAPAESEETRSLRDQANVALGFAALTNNQAEAARNYLQRVRLTGLQANKALLGLGWAAAALKDQRQALVPWQELAGRGLGDSAMLEAQIAVPYALAELGAYAQSAERYTQAIEAFTQETQALTASIAEVRSGKLLDTLADSNPADEMGWFWNLKDLPALPHAKHLSQVLAQHDFQEALKNYRDLKFLARNLAEWQDKLAVFDDMLATRRKAFAERLPDVKDRAGTLSVAPLQERHAKLSASVSDAQAAADGVALADAKQLDLLGRMASVQNGLQDTAGDAAQPELTGLRDRARLAQGALSWQLAQAYPGRVWQAKRELQATHTLLEQAQTLDAALRQAQREEPLRFDAFAQRIAAFTPALQALIPRVAALSQAQQVALQDIAVTALRQQQDRLADYAAQAQFAVAQLYDHGTLRGAHRASQP